MILAMNLLCCFVFTCTFKEETISLDGWVSVVTNNSMLPPCVRICIVSALVGLSTWVNIYILCVYYLFLYKGNMVWAPGCLQDHLFLFGAKCDMTLQWRFHLCESVNKCCLKLEIVYFYIQMWPSNDFNCIKALCMCYCVCVSGLRFCPVSAMDTLRKRRCSPLL